MTSPSQPRPSDLVHVPVRLRVTVDRNAWDTSGADLLETVRRYVVEVIRDLPLVVNVRRDGA